MGLMECIKKAVEEFNSRVKEDEKMSKNLEGIERTVLVTTAEGDNIHFYLKDRSIQWVKEGPVDNPDVIISGQRAVLIGVLNKEIKPLKAYASGKIKIKAKLADMLLLQKLLK